MAITSSRSNGTSPLAERYLANCQKPGRHQWSGTGARGQPAVGQLLSGGSDPGALEYVAGGNTGVPMGLLAPGAEGAPSRESVPEAVRALGALAWISSQGVLMVPFRPIALRQKRWCNSERLQLKQLLLQPLSQSPLHQIA